MPKLSWSFQVLKLSLSFVRELHAFCLPFLKKWDWPASIRQFCHPFHWQPKALWASPASPSDGLEKVPDHQMAPLAHESRRSHACAVPTSPDQGCGSYEAIQVRPHYNVISGVITKLCYSEVYVIASWPEYVRNMHIKLKHIEYCVCWQLFQYHHQKCSTVPKLVYCYVLLYAISDGTAYCTNALENNNNADVLRNETNR